MDDFRDDLDKTWMEYTYLRFKLEVQISEK